MFDYRIRFLIKEVSTDPMTGQKEVVLEPYPKWEGGLDELHYTVRDFLQDASGGQEYTYITVSGDDLAAQGSCPPPVWYDSQYRLEQEVEDENYELAAWLRDEIQRMKDEA